MVANIFLADRPHPLTLGLGSKGQISTFSKHGHVANQIKGNHEMQQHGSKYFARRSPRPKVNRSKVNVFRTWLDCISHKMESRNAATWQQILCPQITRTLGMGSTGRSSTF